MGRSSVAALERLVQQSTVLISELSEGGGPGAFVNLRNDYLRNDYHRNDYLKTSTRYWSGVLAWAQKCSVDGSGNIWFRNGWLDGIEVLAFAGFTGICHLQLLVHGFIFFLHFFYSLIYLFSFIFIFISSFFLLFFFFTALTKCIFFHLFPNSLFRCAVAWLVRVWYDWSMVMEMDVFLLLYGDFLLTFPFSLFGQQ